MVRTKQYQIALDQLSRMCQTLTLHATSKSFPLHPLICSSFTRDTEQDNIEPTIPHI